MSKSSVFWHPIVRGTYFLQQKCSLEDRPILTPRLNPKLFFRSGFNFCGSGVNVASGKTHSTLQPFRYFQKRANRTPVLANFQSLKRAPRCCKIWGFAKMSKPCVRGIHFFTPRKKWPPRSSRLPIFTNPTKPCVSGTTFFDTSKKWRHYCTVRTLLRNRPNGCSVKPFFAASQKSASRCHENSGFAKMDKRHASGDPFFNHLKKGAPRSSRLLIFVNPTFSSQRDKQFYQKTSFYLNETPKTAVRTSTNSLPKWIPNP